jgi:hypothetical protein
MIEAGFVSMTIILLQLDPYIYIFFEMGENYSGLCIKMMHTTIY